MTGSVFNSKHPQQGVTLVELMISMVITMIIMAGVVQVMLDNRQKFKLNDELSYIQENARFALDEIGRDLRMAGFNGCGASANVANVINGGGSSFYNGFGLQGWDGSEATANFPDEYEADLWASNLASAPDSFVVSRANSDNAFTTSDSPTNSNNSQGLDIVGTHDIKKNAIIVIASKDCGQVTTFVNVQQNNNDTAGHFSSNTGNSVSPRNCEKSDLFGSGTCADSPSNFTTKSFGEGASIMEFMSNAYYIAPSSIDTAIPSLYREVITEDESASSTTTAAEELLIGIENMQLVYGVDTDGTADGVANRYLDADEIDGTSNKEWARVVSVRVDLLLRSLDPIWGEDEDFIFDATTYTGRELRQRVSSTILLRNMAIVK